MPNSITLRHGQDHTRIDLSQSRDVLYWTTLFGCTEEQLREAVRKAGSSNLDKVLEHITLA
jgi:hypothetical protein